MVVLNFSKENQNVIFDKEREGRVLFGTHRVKEEAVIIKELTVLPYEVLIFG
jgi:hypothetical protein